MKAYKVFRIQNNKLTSISKYYFDDDYDFLKYSKSKWNERLKDCGPFTAFRTLKDAKRLLLHLKNISHKWKIYKIKGKKSKERYIYDQNYEDYYEDMDGVILLDRFKIIKEVEV